MLSCKTTKLTNVLSLFKVPVLSSMYKDVTVVYAIVTAHKGKISAKSEDGNSLTFPFFSIKHPMFPQKREEDSYIACRIFFSFSLDLYKLFQKSEIADYSSFLCLSIADVNKTDDTDNQ